MHDKRWAGHGKVRLAGPGQGYQLHILGKILPRVDIDPHQKIMKLSEWTVIRLLIICLTSHLPTFYYVWEVIWENKLHSKLYTWEVEGQSL